MPVTALRRVYSLPLTQITTVCFRLPPFGLIDRKESHTTSRNEGCESLTASSISTTELDTLRSSDGRSTRSSHTGLDTTTMHESDSSTGSSPVASQIKKDTLSMDGSDSFDGSATVMTQYRHIVYSPSQTQDTSLATTPRLDEMDLVPTFAHSIGEAYDKEDLGQRSTPSTMTDPTSSLLISLTRTATLARNPNAGLSDEIYPRNECNEEGQPKVSLSPTNNDQQVSTSLRPQPRQKSHVRAYSLFPVQPKPGDLIPDNTTNPLTKVKQIENQQSAQNVARSPPNIPRRVKSLRRPSRLDVMGKDIKGHTIPERSPAVTDAHFATNFGTQSPVKQPPSQNIAITSSDIDIPFDPMRDSLNTASKHSRRPRHSTSSPILLDLTTPPPCGPPPTGPLPAIPTPSAHERLRTSKSVDLLEYHAFLHPQRRVIVGHCKTDNMLRTCWDGERRSHSSSIGNARPG